MHAATARRLVRWGLTLAAASIVAPPAPAAAQAAPAVRAAAGLADLSRSLEQLVDRVSPSVIQIFVTGYAPPDDEDPSMALEPEVQRSSGSGVIVDPDGYIVTNAHVVENATRLEVELPGRGGADGRSIVRRRGRMVGAQIVAVDHETDLAVLKVAAPGLVALSFGDSDTLRPGQLVLAFGSPLGLDSSVTMGVVSAVARQLTPDDPMIYLQTDAPINPGSSGGAVVDMEGRLIGISTLIYSQSGGNEGIGFAAPSNIVRNVVAQVRAHGRVRRGEIGVNAQTVTPLMGEALKIAQEASVVLADVFPGGPAERAGLRTGDLVLTLDGKRMENARQFRINLYTRGVGDSVAIGIARGDSRLTINVAVAERDDDVTRLADLVNPQNTVPQLGILGIDVGPSLAAMLPDLRGSAGVVVAVASGDMPYSQQGRLMPGDVIYAVNGQAAPDVSRLKTLLAAIERNTPFVLQIERGGILQYLAFRVEK